MNAPALKQVLTIFREDGSIEYAVSYAHIDEPPTPGSKKRTTTASRMARRGLQAALEGLDQGYALTWGGFGTNTRESTDRIIVEREENAA